MSPLTISSIGTHLTQRRLEVTNVITAEIDPVVTSQLLQFIRNQLPQYPELTHLRRIRHSRYEEQDMKLEVVIAPEDEDVSVVVNEFHLAPKIRQVPKWPPVSREQFTEWSKLWPLIGRIHVPQTPPPAPHAADTFFRKLSSMLQYQTVDQPIASLAVDPVTNEIVAMALDTRVSSNNPLCHSVMNLTMEVANKERDRRRRRAENGPLDAADYEDKYLCQYLDVYTTHEPCIMCTMALVHSRIGRLVYAVSMKTGGLMSSYGLHNRKELNWRFEGWKIDGWESKEVDLSLNA